MRLNRYLIREFISKVEWATARNICYLMTGKADPGDLMMCRVELNAMTRTLNPELKLKKLKHEYYTAYTQYLSKRTHIGRKDGEHNIKLRDCLARYVYQHGNGWLAMMTIKTFADAQSLNVDNTEYYFEFDNGTKSPKQLEEDIRKHYLKSGAYRVIYWMTTDHFTAYKDAERIKKLEENRLQMLFDIIRKLLKDKPNRILGACYHQYLIDGKLQNYRGEEK